jgi:hypothetical protein
MVQNKITKFRVSKMAWYEIDWSIFIFCRMVQNEITKFRVSKNGLVRNYEHFPFSKPGGIPTE